VNHKECALRWRTATKGFIMNRWGVSGVNVELRGMAAISTLEVDVSRVAFFPKAGTN
jgi:hypothetical protein